MHLREELTGDSSPDALSDVFAFGTIYYELLTGVHPFRNESPVPLRTRMPECPRGVGAAGRSRAQYEPQPALPEHG